MVGKNGSAARYSGVRVARIKVGLFVRADSPIKSIKDMKGKTVFITGASRGIGKAIGLLMAMHGCVRQQQGVRRRCLHR